MRITIKDIAEKTGLSVTTVSLVLNNKKHKLAEATRKKVWSTAQELNYRPNQFAVSLITRKSKTVGLIIPDVTNLFFAEVAKGAETKCQERGYSLMLCNTDDSPEKDIAYMNVLLDRGVDGVIFAMSMTAHMNKAVESLELPRSMEKPVLQLDRVIQGFPTASVMTDNELGGYIATKHLLELGHQKIACLTGPMSGLSSRQRLFGYIRALQERQISFEPTLTAEGDYRVSSGYELSKGLIEKGATAIFAFNDMMAYGIYRQAEKMGMRIPVDLSIVGYDDLLFSEIMVPPLTSIKQPAYQMGECAAEKIIDQIEKSTLTAEDMLFEPSLVIRKSTGRLDESDTFSIED